MRLNIRLTALGARHHGEIWAQDLDSLEKASQSWRELRDDYDLVETDVISVTVTDSKGEHVGSVSWHGSIYGPAGPGMPSSEMPLLYVGAEVVA